MISNKQYTLNIYIMKEGVSKLTYPLLQYCFHSLFPHIEKAVVISYLHKSNYFE